MTDLTDVEIEEMRERCENGLVLKGNAKIIPKLLTALEEARAERDRLRRIAVLAERVMDLLEEHGGSIVPHLLDTDENDGERLRRALNPDKEGEDE